MTSSLSRTLFASLLLLGATLQAQPVTDREARRIDSVFAAYDRTTSPGCALGVYRNNSIAYARGYGMANLEHALAITPRTVFDIGSTSKQFAAATIVLLQLDGKLSIDDEVRKYIPELPSYQRPVTIRHMLNHTSGLRDYLTLMRLHGTDFDGVTNDQDALDLIVRQTALNFEPGSEFLYSNSGFFLLSQIVKRVSGKTLAQFAHERIFAPLGMQETHFHDDHRMIVPQRATGYSPGPGGHTIEMSLFEQTGDGAVFTTVEDLIKWDRNFYTPTVGGSVFLDALHTVGRLNNGRSLEYALGLFVDQYRGLRRVHHGGAWAGYRAELVRFPDEKTSIAVLCNLATANPTALATRVADVLLEAKLGPPATASSPSEGASPPAASTTPATGNEAARAEYAGSYLAPEVDALYTVRATPQGLSLRAGKGLEVQLPPMEKDTFGTRQMSIAFVRDGRGRVTAFTINAGRVRGILASRAPRGMS